jgi:hypothetical protein
MRLRLAGFGVRTEWVIRNTMCNLVGLIRREAREIVAGFVEEWIWWTEVDLRVGGYGQSKIALTRGAA